MKEDKNLKELLQNNLMEETSAGFTEKLMQRINIASTTGAYTRSLWEDKLFKVIAAAFTIISILLLLLNIPFGRIVISFNWKFEMPSALSLQIIQFLFAFWIVMIVNQLLLGRKQKEA
ncbi:MAG: hypothetical protein ACTHJ5_10065 [Ilyomonas sp.]